MTFGYDSPDQAERARFLKVVDDIARAALKRVGGNLEEAGPAALAAASQFYAVYAVQLCGYPESERKQAIELTSATFYGVLLEAVVLAMNQLRNQVLARELQPKPHWEQKTLGEIIPEEATDSITAALNELKKLHAAGRMDGSAAHTRLLAALEPYREAIEAKGTDLKFLAYSLENAIRQGVL